MAMMRYGSAKVIEPNISSEQWTKSVCCGKKDPKCSCLTGGSCRVKVARTILAKYDPLKYLLSHCSIVAAVDTENATESKSQYKDYLIHPAYSSLVNNNGDAWTKKILANTYRTFIGSNNWLEHCQIPELSKGKVIDAVLREVPVSKDTSGKDLTSYYVDILVATERKHKELVRKIEAGELKTLSMGCFLEGTEITLADGTKRPIEEIKQGDLVFTHKGNIKPVLHTQKSWYKGNILEIETEGNYKTTRVTPEHPFWSFKRERICACGCGEKIDTILCGHEDKSEDGHPVFSRFKPGHYARIVNPNSKTYSLDEYRKLKEENPIREKLSLSWSDISGLKKGDLVSYPISDYVVQSPDATIEKARLIGYFLAEGSFVKEVTVEGNENDYGVKCRICGKIYNRLAPHLSTHSLSVAEYQKLYPQAPTKAKINKQLIRVSRKQDSDVEGFTKTRKRVGVEFSLGPHEYNTLNKEIVELAKKAFPDATVLRYKDIVKVIGESIADFFYKYCGEYSSEKVISNEVLYWNKDIQRHIVATWVLGDYSTTGSKKLADQLRFLSYRLRINHNLYHVAESLYECDVKRMTADGLDVTKHYAGVRSESYMIQLNFPAYEALHNELNFAFNYSMPKRFLSMFQKTIEKTHNTWKNSHNLDCMVRPIQEIKEVPYEGWVHNFSVADDDSYIANDMAVHNCKISFSICTKCGNKAVDETEACDHVRYEKGNVFYDENGIQRKVAELCGHHTVPDSVVFMDASWVANPAFTGAVIRNIINPPENIMAKIEEAEKKEGYQAKDTDYLKAAKKTAQKPKEDPPADEPVPEAPPADAPPADEPAPEAPADAPAEEAPADEPAPEEAPAPAPAEDPVKTWKTKIKQKLMDEIGDQIVNEFSGDDDEGDGPRELETLDENMIHPTASLTLKRMWKMKKGWDEYLTRFAGKLSSNDFKKLKFGTYMILTSNDLKSLAEYGYNRRDFLAVMSCLDSCFRNKLSRSVIKALTELNGTKGLTSQKALYAIQKYAGRKLTGKETVKALTWLKLMDLYPE